MTMLIDITENDYEQCVEAYKQGSRDRLIVAIAEGDKVQAPPPSKYRTEKELREMFEKIRAEIKKEVL